jgi:hypothetical protein
VRTADPNSFTQIRRRRSTGFLLQSFQVRRELNVIDADFTGRRKFDRARAGVSSESGGAGGIKGGGCTVEAKLIFRA